MRKYLICSFSGGRTSAFMTLQVKFFRSFDYEKVIYVFANTGEENPETLAFVHRFQKAFEIPLVWVEAVVSDVHGEGTSFMVVTPETASGMNKIGGPFEQVTAKYGVSNKTFPSCSRELKARPIHAYARSLGWKRADYDTAIGIRADEIDRMSVNAQKDGVIYPLVKAGITKKRVMAFWRNYPEVDLRLIEQDGNCAWCWKKSNKKLFSIATDHPERFDFPARMEATYGMVGPEQTKGPDGKGRRFFRGNRTVQDILNFRVDPENDDLPNGCEESCEADI